MTNELTVRVEHPELPAIRWNETEVQQNLTEMLAAYTGRVYTPDTIKDAKADRAAVNKLDKQLSDAARSAKAFYMKPLEEFLQSAKQMQGQCKAVSGAIDQQVKAVEEAERQDKQDALRAVYADCIGELRELIPFDRLLVPQWLNKTYDLAKASRELRKSVETRREELRLIRETCGEDAEACTTEYLRELNLNAALVEHSRRQNALDAQRRAEAERMAAERVQAAAPVVIPPTEEERQIAAEAVQTAQANAAITSDGRLDFSMLQKFAEPAQQEAPARKQYRFWWSSPGRTLHGSSREPQSAVSAMVLSNNFGGIYLWHLLVPAHPRLLRPFPMHRLWQTVPSRTPTVQAALLCRPHPRPFRWRSLLPMASTSSSVLTKYGVLFATKPPTPSARSFWRPASSTS